MTNYEVNVKALLLILFIIIFCRLSYAQEKERNWTLNGYVKDMQTILFQRPDSAWITDNLIHNRLNFKWYMSESFTGSIEMRNRFIYGEFIKYFPGYDELIDINTGWLDMSEVLVKENSFLLHSAIDRLWLDYTRDKFQVRVGRQRINWGQTMVWNPNDLFNTYSFFDFDYEEKPGSDAVRLQYYTGAASHVELAVKANNEEKVTAAGLYAFNKWNYDIQFLGGMLDQEDYVLGTGWSGELLKGGFRGEVNYFHPKDHFEDTSGVTVGTVSYEYTFKNGIFFLFQALYNESGKKEGDFSLDEFYYQSLSAKNLSMTRWSLMGQASHLVHPLVTVSFSAMYSPGDRSVYLGPAVALSLKDNLAFSFVAQTFQSARSAELGGSGTFIFIRFKWSY